MPSRKLTAAFCESVQPVPGRQMAYPDTEARGLELRVSPGGRKVWSFRYRTRLGREGRITLGLYSSEYDLARARVQARKARVAVDDGGDPAADLRTAREAVRNESVQTFADLANAYFDATERGWYRPKRASSLKAEKGVYAAHVGPALGRLRLETITRRAIRVALTRMLEKGVTSQAVRAQALVRQIYAFAVTEERLQINLARDIPVVAASRARTRVYDDSELRTVWRGVCDPADLVMPEPWATRWRTGGRVQIGPAMQIALKLTILLLQRRCEVLGMAVSELDLAQAVWKIPAERMKSKRPHAVPLSAAAIGLIEQAIALNAGRRTSLVFPSRVDAARPMNGASMNRALSCVLLASGIGDGTIHDLRRTGSTAMTSERLGISPFIRSKVLGHSDAGGGATVSSVHYDANAYLAEKRRALEAWQGLLVTIVAAPGQPAS